MRYAITAAVIPGWLSEITVGLRNEASPEDEINAGGPTYTEILFVHVSLLLCYIRSHAVHQRFAIQTYVVSHS